MSVLGLSESTPALWRFTDPRPKAVVWVSLWTVAIVAELLALLPVVTDRGAPVTGPAIAFSLVGGSFAVCGLIGWHRRPDSRSGALMAATGYAFFVPALLGPRDSELAQTIGDLTADWWIFFFVALLLTFLTAGRLRSPLDKALVASFALPVVVLQVIDMLASGDFATAVDKTQRALVAGLCVVVAGVIGVRWVKASRRRRRALLPSVAGAGCLLLFVALLINDLVTGSRNETLLWIAGCSLVSVPAAFLAGLLRSRLARGALTDLMRSLRTQRNVSLQQALATTLDDPLLTVAYRLPGSLGYADAGGEPVLVPPVEPDRASARIEHDGEELAALVYDAGLDDDPELLEAVVAAAAIAIENERLQAESAQRVLELRASRERLVTAGDAERRRLERNLHDGAQQRLVAIALQLRILQGRIRRDPEAAEELAAAAGDELALSLAELRELARGIHPAVLEHGLAAALESLASRSPVPTTVACDLQLSEPLELAAYFVASEALANVAKYSRATSASVRIWRAGDMARIEIADDGVGGADASSGSGLRGLADRVEALDGRLSVVSPLGAGTIVAAELPCA